MKNYLLVLLYGLDVFINSLFPGAEKGQTISARWGKYKNSLLEKFGAKVLDSIEPGHVEKAASTYDKIKEVLDADDSNKPAK